MQVYFAAAEPSRYLGISKMLRELELKDGPLPTAAMWREPSLRLSLEMLHILKTCVRAMHHARPSHAIHGKVCRFGNVLCVQMP